jgi:hypothetical protein
MRQTSATKQPSAGSAQPGPRRTGGPPAGRLNPHARKLVDDMNVARRLLDRLLLAEHGARGGGDPKDPAFHARLADEARRLVAARAPRIVDEWHAEMQQKLEAMPPSVGAPASYYKTELVRAIGAFLLDASRRAGEPANRTNPTNPTNPSNPSNPGPPPIYSADAPPPHQLNFGAPQRRLTFAAR